MAEKKTWFELNSQLYERVKKALVARVPDISVEVNGGFFVGRGNFPVICNSIEIDFFEFGIIFPKDYPRSYPWIMNFDSRIPKGSNPDWHTGANGIACLSLDEQIWLDVGDPQNIDRFLDKTVNDYFIQQSHRIINGKYLDEWDHFTKGRLQFYAQRFPLAQDDPRTLCKVLAIISANDIKGHHPCPFCVGKKIRDCHFSEFKRAQVEIRRDFLLAAHAEVLEHVKKMKKA